MHCCMRLPMHALGAGCRYNLIAPSVVQAWWRKMLADLAIHWVLRQFRRSVFITQFAYSSMKAKTLAEEYAKYQSSVDSLNTQFGSAQQMIERDLVSSKFEEQLKRGVDAAYRNQVCCRSGSAVLGRLVGTLEGRRDAVEAVGCLAVL